MVFNFHGSIELTEEQINDIVNMCIEDPDYSIDFHIRRRLSFKNHDYRQGAIPFIKPEIEKRLKNLEKPLDKSTEI